MQTTPADDALNAELFERSTIVTDLDGPQIEAWVSGLFVPLDSNDLVANFVDYCRGHGGATAVLLCEALAELADDEVARLAREAVNSMHAPAGPAQPQIGSSSCTGAWRVTAPFGRSLVLGFDVPAPLHGQVKSEGSTAANEDVEDDGEGYDGRHSILVEIGPDATGEADVVQDLQLAGPPEHIVDDAASADERVKVEEVEVAEAVGQILDAWIRVADATAEFGPGVGANEHFVRNRLERLTDREIPRLKAMVAAVDIRRGLSDDEFVEANRAARSTLQAALGDIVVPDALTGLHQSWIDVLRGDVAGVSARERDALLWLEWADWLGAGIGLLRAGAEVSDLDGEVLVDMVNRCPEVSSTIDKADREYAAWAFDVALEHLGDAGVYFEGRLTEGGFDALGPAMATAWS